MSQAQEDRDYSFFWESETFKDENGQPFSKSQVIDYIVDDFLQQIKSLEKLLDDHDLIEHCTVNTELVWQATLCCFADLTRMMSFHSINYPAREKYYAYKAFWLLRHHPIQIVSFNSGDFANFEHLDSKKERLVFVNEYLVTQWLFQSYFNKLHDNVKPKIQIDHFSKKARESKDMIRLVNKMYYHFRYRTYTAETILLALESIMETADYILEIT